MSESIRLRNVRVHNLQGVDLDLPKRKLIGFCGPSGSGKSSLAIDTLYAEGQRRYLDTFSTAERGQIEQPEKPDADEMDGIPPAIAIVRSNEKLSHRFTVGALTELLHYFQLAFSQYSEIQCPDCQTKVVKSSPDTIREWICGELSGQQVMIGFDWEKNYSSVATIEELMASGFVRCFHDGQVERIENLPSEESSVKVLVDRIRISNETSSRLGESIEGAFRFGSESCFVAWNDRSTLLSINDGQEAFQFRNFSNRPICNSCGTEFRRMLPSELSFNSHEGACRRCNGLGSVDEFQKGKLIRNPKSSIAKGAIPILLEDENTVLLDHMRKSIASGFDQTIESMTGLEKDELWNQIVVSLYEFESTGSRSHKALVESFRAEEPCKQCRGTGFNSRVLAHYLGEHNLGSLVKLSIEDLAKWSDADPFTQLLDNNEHLIEEIRLRLEYLRHVGVGYLSLNRKVNSLSTGERQRVAMTNALGSKLVNLLYVFDEPCSGLHPADLPNLVDSLRSLAEKGNTVITVDHELELIKTSDHVTEFGPGAGVYGGKIAFDGTPNELVQSDTITSDYLNHRRALMGSEYKREAKRGRIQLTNARGNNLKNIDVDFPLSLLCVVTGVSGSGKSSLVVDTLYPAIHNQINQDCVSSLPFDAIKGTGAINEVVLVDQSAIGANSRSNPATYTKAFDAIRNVFAETIDAKTRNIKAGRFSFNTKGGRCDACNGEGTKQIDMQFLANLHVKCKFCKGLRYKREVLQCKYRGQSIADVLNMTVRESFSFFRGQKKVQTKLKPLMDVGLDYLQLGQPATTLSSGESQRMRLAGFLSSGKKARTLFIMDEPTVGLHYCDVVKLLDCFDALLAEGHSIVVVEHNKLMMNAADYVIDLGPGPGEDGGRIVAAGAPSEISIVKESKTGQVLAELAQLYEKSNPSSSS